MAVRPIVHHQYCLPLSSAFAVSLRLTPAKPRVQVYKHLDVGSDKLPPSKRRGVPCAPCHTCNTCNTVQSFLSEAGPPQPQYATRCNAYASSVFDVSTYTGDK